MSEPQSIHIPPIRTERLLLRPLVESDRAAYIRLHETSGEHLRRWSPSRPAGESLDALFDRQIERARTGLATGTAARLAAFDALSGALAGLFNLNNITRGVAQYADAGWAVSAEFIGRGFATEGVWALLDLAFSAPREDDSGGLGLHRVQANVIPENAPSLRVAAKCGFRIEGLALAMLQINGRWRDHAMHAKLAEEHQFKYLG